MMKRSPRHAGHPAAIIFTLLLLMTLVSCDPGGRLAQLTPQAPVATPMLLGVTGEAPGIGAVATAAVATAAPETAAASGDQPVPLPTPTYDPALPAWTFLYYAGADSPGRAGYVWGDLNEMESAGPSDQVTIVAQVDWPDNGPADTGETVRYTIAADPDPGNLASEGIALGEVNVGDPATLADFIAWGMATHPANHYALFLGDFGGGWQGCCLDGVPGASGENDHLSLPDLDQALAAAYGQSGARLDVIAFSAGQMSDLDVLQAIQPYGDFAVASAGLMPGSAWDYSAVLAQVNADPLVDGRQLAGDLTTAFVNYQRQLAGDEYVSMSAIDLARVPAVAAAVESMALTLGSEPALHGAIAAEGRRGAQRYGAAATTEADQLSAVDLLQAAAIVTEYAPPGELQNAAAAVGTAVADAIIAYDHGQGVPNGRGLAIYWPATPEALNPVYSQVSRLPSWAAFLGANAPEASQPPQVVVDRGPRETIHIANPSLLHAEITGQRLDEITLIADQQAADGRRVVRQYQTVLPTPLTLPGGTSATLWQDGRHESLIVWDATGPYLADASGNGDYVALHPVDPSPVGSQLAVPGRFRPGGAETGPDATVTFDEDVAASRRLWVTAAIEGDGRLVGETMPLPGDVFQPATEILRPDGSLTAEPGVALVFDDVPAIYRSTRPLPGGEYAIGIRARPLGGEGVLASQTLVVDPAGAVSGFRAFVDAAHDVQFLYPADWLPPVNQDNVTFTSNISNTAQLQVRYYPNWTADLTALQSEVLGTFGEVSILMQEENRVGTDASIPAIRTAYGYESADQGPRVGMFLTFLNNNVGYVVDLDAPREQETATLAAVDTMAATWQFLPPRLGFGPEPWSVLNVADFRMTYPAHYEYQAFNNWHRFTTDAQTFIAVRIQPGGRAPSEAMAGLLETAAEGVAGFTAEEPQRLFYAGHLWERNDFHYTGVDGTEIAGLLLSRLDGDTEVAVWAEGLEPIDDLLNSIFLPTAASIERIPPPPSG